MCATRLWGYGRRLDGTADPAWEARVAELWKAIGTHENNWLGRRGLLAGGLGGAIFTVCVGKNDL